MLLFCWGVVDDSLYQVNRCCSFDCSCNVVKAHLSWWRFSKRMIRMSLFLQTEGQFWYNDWIFEWSEEKWEEQKSRFNRGLSVETKGYCFCYCYLLLFFCFVVLFFCFAPRYLITVKWFLSEQNQVNSLAGFCIMQTVSIHEIVIACVYLIVIRFSFDHMFVLC